MFRGLPQYEALKPSGLPWATEVPAHWAVERAKTVMTALDQRSRLGDEELLTVSSGQGVIPRNTTSVSMFQADSYVGHKLCWPGDLVINSLWAWSRGLGVSAHYGIVSTAYGVYRLRGGGRLLPGYLHQLVRSDPFQWELQVRSQGVWKSRLQMTDARWLDAPLLLPPPEEQAAIVKYLAHANARIDKAIAAKRRLIALLEEQSMALPGEVLQSGEWPRRRLKTVLDRVDQGVSPQAENQEPGPGEWGVLKAGCVNNGFFHANQVKRLPSGFAIPEAFRVREGDLLVSRANGSPRLVGSAARVSGMKHQAILSDKTFRLVSSPTVDADFLAMAMNTNAYRQQVLAAISGAEGLANNLPLSALRTFEFVIPPLDVQRVLVRTVEEETSTLRFTMNRIAREIALLQEFRTRLVADVVTGQVDVRAIAAALPEAPEDVAGSHSDGPEEEDAAAGEPGDE